MGFVAAPQGFFQGTEVSTQGLSNSLSGKAARAEKPPQTIYAGIPASPGVAIGRFFAAPSASALEAVPDTVSADPGIEIAMLDAAMHALQDELQASGRAMASRLPEEIGALYAVYEMILADPQLRGEIVGRIRSGQSAAAAVRDTVTSMARQFEAMENAYLRARAEDARAVGRRILRHLISGAPDDDAPPQWTILLGKGLGLACLSAVPGDQLVGLVCTGGSRLSHGVIIARALGIPAVVGVSGLRLEEADGHEVILDGYRGQVILDPEPALRAEFDRLRQEASPLPVASAGEHELPARTIDGVQVALQANIALLREIPLAKEQGAEGVGLYRTELPFLLRTDAPDEDTQYAIYRELLESFAPRPVTMRTLDAGGDKPLLYLPQDEANPALGRRGIRLCLAYPELFLTQLRALLRANAGLGNLRLMLPMVTTPSDIAEARVLIDHAHRELQSAGRGSALPPVGIMIEVPAAVFGIDALVEIVDFISIGTNDLAQYVLAADRTNPALEKLCDPLTPAVLRAIGMAAEGAARRGIPVSVCGELAGDPFGALLLLGLGVDALSLSAGGMPRIRHLVRRVARADARELWKLALTLHSARAVRDMLAEALAVRGLGSLSDRPLDSF
ncbi:MAG: phosphoenolpyruvate--protein phosphotransferase [Chromatiaceae bacterium]